MLRVGLTGGLGSGKSTAARLFAQHGAYILESDAIGREMMQPGQTVYAAIVEHFGPAVLGPDAQTEERQLDRAALAHIAFTEGRVEELNAIVHPAVIARQEELAQTIFASDPRAIVIVESALIFETRHAERKDGEPEPWRNRFDCLILVAAPEEIKIEHYLQRMAAGDMLSPERRAELTADARSRLSRQIPDERKAELSDFVLINDGSIAELEEQVDELWPVLQFASVNT